MSDSALNVELKVKEFLKRMTLEEKIAQLGSVQGRNLIENGKFSRRKAELLLKHGIGQITRVSGGTREVKDPKQMASIANEIQRFLIEETRLGIPAIIHEECLSGLMAYGATVFPQAIGLASTWNPRLVENVSSTIRRQMMAVGARQGLSPLLDVCRDPRWGRNEETFGEDPYLVACIGVAYIKGLQGSDIREGVIATPKHFAAYGFSEGGRNLAPVHVPPRELREVYLFPFEAAIKETSVLSIMNAYHEIDGVPCAASRWLLTDMLRGEWGFKGYVVSDYSSIKMLRTFHHVASDDEEAAVKALEAGVDIELPETDCYGEPLLNAVKKEKIPMKVIDQAVSRILRAKILLGLFENPYVDVESASKAFDTDEDRMLALKAARESIVLLKNDGVLPLRKDIRAIAVVGPNADDARNLHGDYSYTSHLRCEEPAVRTVTVLEGIKRKVSGETCIYYAKGCGIMDKSREGFRDALKAAEKSEVVIAVLGERSGLSEEDVSGEGRDRADVSLPGVQEDLIEALHEAGKPIILVLINGRPLSLRRIVDKCSAIIEAWLPGEEGGNAVADVLFGDYNPGGKLPTSFPEHVGQLPINYGRKPSSMGNYVSHSSKPLFPFGHGLSYTRFEYSSLNICPDKIGATETVRISFNIENVGERIGDEVVQLYVQDEVASVTRPMKELKGFKRLTLNPGEKRKLTFKLSAAQLAFYDREMRLVVEPGKFKVMIGGSSEDIRLTGKFEVVEGSEVIPSARIFFSQVEVE